MTGKRVLIAGCGRLGTRLGRVLNAAGHEVHGLRRRPAGLPEGIHPIAADLVNDTDLSARLPRGLDQVYTILTPTTYDDAGYRDVFVTGLQHLIEALAITGSGDARLIFVSSTGVYGQDDGQWVDETSPTQPTRFSGERLLEGEAMLRRHPGETVAVRFGGIYGRDGGGLLARVRRGDPCAASPPRYTNRIHEEDCVGVLRHVGRLMRPPKVVLGVDDAPCSQCEIMDWLAGELGQSRPARVAGGGSGRRCLNHRLRASGYRFRHPTYRQGYQRFLRRSGV